MDYFILPDGKILRWHNDGYMYVGDNNKPLVKLANYTDVSGLYVASGTYTVTANMPYSTYTEVSFNINASFNQSYQNVLFFSNNYISFTYDMQYNISRQANYDYIIRINNNNNEITRYTVPRMTASGEYTQRDTLTGISTLNFANNNTINISNPYTQLQLNISSDSFLQVTMCNLDIQFQYIVVGIA